MKILAFFFLAFTSVFSAFSQASLTPHGPYFIGDFIHATYGKNNRLFVADEVGGLWYTDDRQLWKKPNALFPGASGFAKDAADNLYVYHFNGLFFKSTDNGDTWSSAQPFLTDPANNGTVVFPKYVHGFDISGDTLYFSHSRGFGWFKFGSNGTTIDQFDDLTIRAFDAHYNKIVVSTAPDTIHVSFDSGKTWTRKKATLDGQTVRDIVVTDKRIWLASYDVWYSDDWGDTWYKTPGVTGAADLEWTANRLYTAGQNVAYFSDDENKWIDLTGDDKYWSPICLAAQGTNVFAARSANLNALNSGAIQESVNYGNTWNNVKLTGLSSGVFDELVADSEGNIYASGPTYVFRKKKDEDLFTPFNLMSNAGLVIQNDTLYVASGYSLKAFDSRTGEPIEFKTGWSSYIYDVGNIAKSGDYLFVASADNGIFRVQNGGEYEDFNNELTSTLGYVRSLTVSKGNLYLVTQKGVFRSGVETPGWQKIYPTDGSERDVVSIEFNGNTIVISNAVSHDNGTTWQTFNERDAFYDIDYKDGRFVAVGYGHVYVSHDDGNTWGASVVNIGPDLFGWSVVQSHNYVYIGSGGNGIWSMTSEDVDIITGISEKSESFAKIFPNPASDQIIVDTPIDSNIELIDVLGASIERRSSHAGDQQVFHLQSLNAGVYLFKIYEGSNLAVKKFVKQ